MISSFDQVDLTAMVTRAVRSVTAGIAPHRDGRETEEYRCNVPVWLRNRAGLPGDEVAAILAVERPELGITSENDLYALLADGATARVNGTAEYTDTREDAHTMNATATPTTGFDAADAAQALAEFTFALADIDQDALKLLQTAWQAAYLRCGHKALARALVTGDTAKSLKGIQRRAAKLAAN